MPSPSRAALRPCRRGPGSRLLLQGPDPDAERPLRGGSEPIERAIGIWRQLSEENPSDLEHGNMVGNAERFLCRTLLDLDRPEEALARCDRAARVHGVVVAAQQENLVVRGNTARLRGASPRRPRA